MYAIERPFGVFVDMRTLATLQPDAQQAMQEGQLLYREAGMQRSVVIVNSAVLAMQFKRLAKQTGIYEWERYLNAATPDWERIGLAWLEQGADPDQAGRVSA